MINVKLSERWRGETTAMGEESWPGAEKRIYEGDSGGEREREGGRDASGRTVSEGKCVVGERGESMKGALGKTA